MKKNIIKIIIFFTISFFLGSELIFYLQNKNSHIDELYSMRNCDVLVLGASKSYVNLSGAVMYDNYGIASACIAQGEQQIRMSYYSLKSALRFCKPKLVVFEVYMAVADDDYGNMPNQYANALLSFPAYSNLDVRLEAIDDLKGVHLIDYLTGIPLYHNDYKTYEFCKKEHTAGYMNGFLETRENGLVDYCFSIDSVSEKQEIGRKSKDALLKTIKLCNDKNIDLIFLSTPFQAADWHMEKLKTVKDIANKNHVPFIDMNTYIDEIGIDLLNDMHDMFHAKKSGEEKNSIWLGNWLISNYKLEDRRSNPNYKYWDLVSQERKQWEKEISHCQ